jgi:hypothetical protein
MIDGITIGHGREEDTPALRRLAALDSRRAPEGEALLAFERTAEIVDLLRLRATQTRQPGLRRRYAARRLLRVLHARAAEPA